MTKAFFSAFLLLIFSAFASAQSAEDIIAKHLEATGAANWSKVNAIKMEATIATEAAAGMTIGWTMTALRDKAARMDVSVMGMTQSSAVKGDQGWSTNPFAGQTDAEPITADQAKSMMDMTDIDGTLVGYQDKGYTVEYVGTEDVEGVEALKIKVSKEDNKVEYSLFDPETYYEIMNVKVEEVDGKEVESKTSYSDFKELNGLVFPFTMQQTSDMMGNSTITLNSILLNPEVDMTIFDMPGK
jgi:hypothetical protein